MNELRRARLRLKAHCLDRPLAWVYAHPEAEVGDEDGQRFAALDARLTDGEPLSYLIETVEFYDIKLRVTSAVLTPRPETEFLVDLAIEELAAGACVLELGTGSGAIALALAKARPDLHITASDASQSAIACAAGNARQLGLTVDLLRADWLYGIRGCFDAILANPPYVESGDACLASAPLKYEPRLALDGGEDGLDAFRRIVAASPERLKPGGMLALEHGHDQGGRVRSLFAAFGFVGIKTLSDLAGHDRVCLGRHLVSTGNE